MITKVSNSQRSFAPEVTYKKIIPLISKMGITRIANITGLDNIGIHVVTVCRPNSKAISVAQGKGNDLISAKVSGVMEAIETYHAENIELPLRLSSYYELTKKDIVINVEMLSKLSVSKFDIYKPILWVKGEDLIDCKQKYLPYEIIHTDYTQNQISGSGSFSMSSNGLASGNHLYEAISHGLSELIERDAISLWVIERECSTVNRDIRRLSLNSITDSGCIELISKFSLAGVLVGIWNVTSDIGLPTFFCMIMNNEKDGIRPLYPACGSGTHPNKSTALSRALTEAAQARLTLISGSRDDIGVAEYEDRQSNSLRNSIRRELELGEALCQFSGIKSWDNETIDEDLNVIKSQLLSSGLNSVMIVDLSLSEFNIPVVRVVVPGLEGIHDSPGYVRGSRALASANALMERSLK